MFHLFAQSDTAAPLTETSGSLRFLAAPEAWVIVLVILPAVALFAWRVYRRETGHTTPRIRLVLGALRAGILLLFIAILFQPVNLITTSRVIQQKLILLVDDSSSMQERDRYPDEEQRRKLAEAAGLAHPAESARLTRSELVKRVLDHGKPTLLERLQARYDTRVYAFDTGLRRDLALADLKSHGTSTRLGEALAKVYTEMVGQPTAAVVVISDGRSNEGTDPMQTVTRLKEMQQIQIPLEVVAVGDPTRRRDLEVQVIKPVGGQDFLVGDQIPFTVEVKAQGFDDATLPVRIEITDEEDRVLASQPIVLNGTGGSRKEVLYVEAQHEGRRTFTVRVPPAEGEADTSNNQRQIVLRIVKKRIKVLYVEGYPRWEYRYLKNALIRDDENFAVNVLLLSAERNFRQEASPEVAPVEAFPEKPADLFAFDVVVLGDVEPNQLADSPDGVDRALQNLSRFVSVAGGGLLMLAGEGSNPFSYAGTPLASALPVVPGGTRHGDSLDFQRAFRPVRTAAGSEDPILVLSKEPATNRLLWEDTVKGVPPLYWYSPVERAKPGARVLLIHPERRNRFGPQPLLVTQFFGKGRSMFLGLDSLWRWRQYEGDHYFYQFYSQALRYLATTKLYRGNKRYDLFADKRRYDIGESVRVSAAVRNQDFQPSDAPHQTVYWQAPGASRPEALQLEKVKRGEYETVIMAAPRGRHTLWIKEQAEAEERADEFSFDVDITPLEKAEPATNAELLARLAQGAGPLGHYHLLHQLPEALDALPTEPVKFPEKTATRDIWDHAWVLCLLTALLAAEWITRKRYRLP